MSLFVIILLLMSCILFTSIKIVREHEKAVIFTLGQYSHTANAGVQIILPSIQKATIVDMREQTEETDNKNITTQDGITINASATVNYKITNPEKAVNQVQDYKEATKSAVEKELKNTLERLDQDKIYDTRHDIKKDIQTRLLSETNEWGIEVTDLDINFRT